MTGPLKRASLWVRDAEASLRLYRDALGLDVIEDKVIAGPAIAAMIGLEDVRLRIVHLSSGATTFGWVGLYEASEARPSLATRERRGTGLAYGDATLVFETRELAMRLPLIEAAGGSLLQPPVSYVKTTASGPTPAGRYTEAIFFDLDDVPVSLMGYEPLG